MNKILLVFSLILLVSCAKNIAPTNNVEWNTIIDRAFEPVECKQPAIPFFGNLSYSGTLIDTHWHIPNIPDDLNARASDRPTLGINVYIADIVCTLEQEGTAQVFAFFPVYKEIPYQMIEVVKKTMQRYPDMFVPFIMPPDHDDSPKGSPTVDDQVLQNMLTIEPGLFKGYGEIGLYERGNNGALALPPDSQRLQEIYPIIRQHNLIVYVHLGEGQKQSFERVLEQNPDVNFIWHGDQLITYVQDEQDLSRIDDILSKYPNVYYGIDELYGDVWLLRPEITKEEFLRHFDNYQELLQKDLKTWKAFIEAHPNQVLWGTDRGWSAPWSADEDVGMVLTSYARAFIAHLDPQVQEKFAYKNAQKLIVQRNE